MGLDQPARVPRKKPEPIVGRRLLRVLEEQLARLHAATPHGNRVLHYDHVVVAHLIAFFNPTVRTLRLVENVFDSPRARRLFKLPAVRRSTLADAQRLFDPALLQPLVDDLAERVEHRPRPAGLDELTRRIVAVDATFFEVAGRILWALPHNRTSGRGSVQLCMPFDVVDGVPAGFTLVDGHQHEATQLGPRLQRNTLYLLDRGYQSYERLDAIAALDSDFVVRVRSSASFQTLESRPLAAADRLAGVRQDRVVTPAARHLKFQTPVRLVEIDGAPSGRGAGNGGAGETAGADGAGPTASTVRLLTNRLDLPAELIGTLYRHRWQVELFFRWLKCVVDLRHFLSESPGGIGRPQARWRAGSVS